MTDAGGDSNGDTGTGVRMGDGEASREEAGMVIGAVAANAGMGGSGGSSSTICACVMVEGAAEGRIGIAFASGTVAPKPISAGCLTKVVRDIGWLKRRGVLWIVELCTAGCCSATAVACGCGAGNGAAEPRGAVAFAGRTGAAAEREECAWAATKPY